MMMLGSLRRMFTGESFASVRARAERHDAAFFAAQYAPLDALAAAYLGRPLLALRQRNAVSELDADHALVILEPQGARAFVTEVGTDFGTGGQTHFLVEVDPSSGARLGNYGPVDLPAADFPATAWALTQIVFAKAHLSEG